MTSKRILIVDDDETILIVMQKMIENEYTVFTVKGGAAALEFIQKENGQFDLIFCDLSMPTMNGAALYLAIVKQYKELENRFIFMTAGPFGNFFEEFGLSDKTPCLDKPVNRTDLDKILLEYFATH